MYIILSDRSYFIPLILVIIPILTDYKCDYNDLQTEL